MKDLGVYQTSQPFTSQFVVTGDKTGLSISICSCVMNFFLVADDLLRILVVQRFPLRLNLVLGKQIWEVFEGRNNLFYTITLMVRYYERHSAGYIE